MNSNINPGDLGFWWRTQTERSMSDLDTLCRYKLYFAKQLGPEKCAEIEEDVILFSDADQFRIYHAKGRFRGTACAIATTGAVATVLNGGSNGIGFLQKNPLIGGAVFLGSWTVFYQFWSRYSGYTAQKYNEFQYARVHKQLRNAQIKQ